MKPAARFQQMQIQCAEKPHGTRARYAGGCKCMLCRAANSRYEVDRAALRRTGEWNGIVSADNARKHILQLSAAGVGRDALSQASDIGKTAICEIRSGTKKRIRAATERAILAVDIGARSGAALVDADATWRILDGLVRDGYTKTQLAEWLGLKGKIQFRRDQVTLETAVRVERLARLINAGKIQRSGAVQRRNGLNLIYPETAG